MLPATSITTQLNKFAGLLLFVFFGLIALFTFQNYGLSWDEDYQREIGLVSWNYIFSNDQTLLTYAMRDYGVAFELPLIALEKLFGLNEEKSIYLMRHLVTHLFFLSAAYYCYKLILLLYKNQMLAVFGFLLFVLFPPIYSHSFFNTKDVPFLSLLTICFYLLVKTLTHKSFLNFLILGIGIGLLINIRIIGVLLPGCALILLMLDAIYEKKVWLNVKYMCILVFTSLFVLILSWPYLWTDPLGNYLTAFSNMSKFRWPHSNLFMGELIPATDIPWRYIPSWFCITMPISYLLIGLLGIVALLIAFLKAPKLFLTDNTKKFSVIFLIFFTVPVVAVSVLHSVLYDGWRHLYFIYPGYVMLCIYALHLGITFFKKGLIIFVSFSFISVAGYMVLNFPHQHIYFNYFVSRHSEPEYIRKNYDLDYWGPGFKQALEYILEHDDSAEVKIYAEHCSSSNITVLLKEADKKRVRLVAAEEATYFVTNYRWHPQDYSFNDKKFYSIKVLNSSVLDVFKLK
jgi:hypothetical protein